MACACLRREAALSYQDKHTPRLQTRLLIVRFMYKGNKKIRAEDFLVGFANYGIEKIFNNISSSSSLVVEVELYKYFEYMANILILM